MAVTTIEELKAKKYIEISLPGWDTDDTFKVRLQRVNILDLASKGKIPNPLMGPVIELFKGKGPEPDSTEGLKLLNELSELFAEVTMVEPTYKEVKEAIGLTDEQKMIIYNFAIQGARAIEPFREKPAGNKLNKHGDNISEKA
ncbi:hypothetical protein [Clostridium algidicarnis]|uniref:hypothetical protein n=1 Tax=Clostridium algidicarnis TaxID=37659 RepID=UPI003FD7FC91